MARVIELDDRNVIRSFLERDPYLHLYEIGDLDDFFWPRTRWYATEAGGGIAAICLVYRGGDLPVLLALEERDPGAANDLVEQVARILPPRVYCHLSPGLAAVLGRSFRLEPHGLHHKMRLAAPGLLPASLEPGSDACRRLTKNDLADILELYRESYPGNWFDPRMLETGKYFGLDAEDRLAAAAGVHVISARYRVAALGNIVTRPEFRNRGLGRRVTARLCRDLLESEIRIGLNVHAGNAAALRCYERLGFERHASYEEHLATRV